MKPFIKSALLLAIFLKSSFTHSQTTTAYADAVLSVTSEYAACPGNWSSCQILGAPNVYPICADHGNAWAFDFNSRQSIVIGYSTQLYVDTVRIYETNNSGLIDTLYLRNAQTGNWNTIYTATANALASCNILDIAISETSYKVDAVRLAISSTSIVLWPEYDAVALIGSPVSTTGIGEQKTDPVSIFPNPSSGNFTLIFSKQHNPYTISIYDMSGRLCYSQNGIIGEVSQLQTGLQPGIYSVEISNETTKIQNKIIVN